MEEIFKFLSQHKPFLFLADSDLKALAEKLVEQKYPKDSILFVQGKSQIDKVYIIKEGMIELFYDLHGKRLMTSFLKEGQVLGGIGVLTNQGVAVRTVKAVEDTVIYAMAQEDFTGICSQYGSFRDFFEKIHNQLMHDESYVSILAAGQTFPFLQGIIPFSFLPENELQNVAGKLLITHYPKDKVLFIQGQSRIEHLYIIHKGAAERYYEDVGKKKLIGVLGEGDLYGGISMLLNDDIAVRTLKTTEKTYFYMLPKADFMDLCRQNEQFSEYFTDTFGKRMLDRSYASIITKSMCSLDTEVQLFSQPVSSIYTKNLLECRFDATIQEAAALMSENRCSSIFVKNAEGKFSGVVTDNDLRKKVVAIGYDIQQPVSYVMTSPLQTLSENSLIFEGLIAMLQKNVKHLAVTDPSGNVMGVVTHRDLISAQVRSPFFIFRQIEDATSKKELMDVHKQLPPMIQSMIQNGAKAKNVTRLITAVSDGILKKLVEFALDELGSPPVDFVFMILGSEGRKEQTLKTDQDNAIIFDDVEEKYVETIRSYFLKLGEMVCTSLDEAGYAFCSGGVMAKNPKWCQPFSVWKDYFRSWILAGNPEDLLHSSIFFDFKGGYGNMDIIDELRNYLFDSVGGWAGFLRNLTENAMYFKPPLGFFRNFVVESKGKHQDSFDIKGAMMPIVDFARIYSLKNKIRETNTQDRLYQLYLMNALTRSDYEDIEHSYSFLMQLRFVRQVTAVTEENEAPDNYINPKKLSRIEQTTLKEIFKRIERMQSRLGFEFTGIA